MIYRFTSDFLQRFTTRVMKAQFQENRDYKSIWSCPFFRHYIMSFVLVPQSPSFIVMTRFVEIRQHMLA